MTAASYLHIRCQAATKCWSVWQCRTCKQHPDVLVLSGPGVHAKRLVYEYYQEFLRKSRRVAAPQSACPRYAQPKQQAKWDRSEGLFKQEGFLRSAIWLTDRCDWGTDAPANLPSLFDRLGDPHEAVMRELWPTRTGIHCTKACTRPSKLLTLAAINR